ncbi:MAG: hypothetical protein H0T78_06930, partial [Longispora sp.]|nr:hypothetical protein [Longispora sp. (in: high G+C Gram-positive bacteria)]
MPTVHAKLPDFPWDALAPYREKALAHPGGLIDLSIGRPVDPVPGTVQAALIAAADAHTYPQAIGSPELRAGLVDWVSSHCGAVDGFDVLPTVGSKEFVAWLPTLLGL